MLMPEVNHLSDPAMNPLENRKESRPYYHSKEERRSKEGSQGLKIGIGNEGEAQSKLLLQA